MLNWILVVNDTEGLEEISYFETKKEARAELNKMVKGFKENDKQLGTYYSESSEWYAIKILAHKDDIENEEDPVSEGKCYSIYLEIKEYQDEIIETE